MSRHVTAAHQALRQSEHPDTTALEQERERLNDQYGAPCDECGVRVARAVPIHPGADEIEYPAGCHAVGCPNADSDSYHPDDPRTE